nr:MAG TPA: PGDYG protein [Caudoviricetes sp.]
MSLQEKRYVKKAIPVYAFRLDEDKPEWFRNEIKKGTVKMNEDGTAEILTLEGTQKARPDDYIICGVRGEIYPCRRDIFEETYYEI